jgi:branched-subunit amino acid aminotransferase/4-amino-4-deoxychorismate lyase
VLNDLLLPTAELPLPNRGLAFGDGFFETLVFADGQLRYAPDHLARMQQAAAALHLHLPKPLATLQTLRSTLTRLAEANELPAARLRLQLWRAGGGRYTPAGEETEWLATAEPYAEDTSPVGRADFARDNHALPSPLSFCKGPQAWLYVRTARERQARGLDEIILCTSTGLVAEAGAAALCWLRDDVLFTPALATGCVAGVRRAHLLRQARQQGLECREGLFAPEAVLEADAVFTANVAGLRLIRQLGTRVLPTALPPLWAALQQWDRQGRAE